MEGLRSGRNLIYLLLVGLLCNLMLPGASRAATAQAIDQAANAELKEFRTDVNGADQFLRHAKAILLFPEIIQAGVGIGGEYGEGVLRIGGKSVGYYSLAAGSFGFQFGAQRKSLLVIFNDEQALRRFREDARTDRSWNVGIDGSVAILTVGGQASIDSATINQPIVGFVFDQKGLMYDLSLQGARISRIER